MNHWAHDDIIKQNYKDNCWYFSGVIAVYKQDILSS